MKKQTIKTGIKTETARPFVVSKLIPIPLVQEKNGRHVDEKAKQTICDRHPDFTSQHGCYVFGIRAGKGVTPVYVGRTTKKPLGFEAFTSGKLHKLDLALQRWKRGTLVVAFVVPKDGNRKIRKGTIEEIESVLIQYAYAKNPEVQNKNGIYRSRWFIEGVHLSEPGRPSQACKPFRDMLGIE